MKVAMTCPHCGVKQPGSGDAFCTDCRKPLDEPPASGMPGSATLPDDPLARYEQEGQTKKTIGSLFLVGGVAFTAVSFLALGHRTFYIVAFGVLLYGAFAYSQGQAIQRKARRLRDERDASGTDPR
jgi:hypothetical protein